MEHTKAYYLALKYYPTLWSADDLYRLVLAGKLREDEYEEIIGENKEASNERSISDNSISTPNP